MNHAAFETNEELLSRLLDYELRASQRYRRFVTVVSVGCEGEPNQFKAVLGESLRNSDAVMAQLHGATILMGETNGAGALTAIKRYKTHCDGSVDMRFGIAAYPTDGCDAVTLLTVAGNRLEEARSRDTGAVVWQGCT